MICAKIQQIRGEYHLPQFNICPPLYDPQIVQMILLCFLCVLLYNHSQCGIFTHIHQDCFIDPAAITYHGAGEVSQINPDEYV